jgi:hypothetical protein
MNPTKIIPGDRNLPVPSADAALAASLRAPTLAARDGSHGDAMVWMPEMAAVRWDVGFVILVTFVVAVLLAVEHHG